MGDQEVTASRQQLDEGGAGARAQGVPGLGLVQGQLQVFQVPRELQQAEGGRGARRLCLPRVPLQTHFTEEEAEALSGWVTIRRPCSPEVAELVLEPRSV